MRLERAYPLVKAMMAMVLVMADHFGIGAAQVRLCLLGLDDRRLRCFARIGGKGGSGGHSAVQKSGRGVVAGNGRGIGLL